MVVRFGVIKYERLLFFNVDLVSLFYIVKRNNNKDVRGLKVGMRLNIGLEVCY